MKAGRFAAGLEVYPKGWGSAAACYILIVEALAAVLALNSIKFFFTGELDCPTPQAGLVAFFVVVLAPLRGELLP